jgi:hypothetical protein
MDGAAKIVLRQDQGVDLLSVTENQAAPSMASLEHNKLSKFIIVIRYRCISVFDPKAWISKSS